MRKSVECQRSIAKFAKVWNYRANDKELSRKIASIELSLE